MHCRQVAHVGHLSQRDKILTKYPVNEHTKLTQSNIHFFHMLQWNLSEPLFTLSPFYRDWNN